MATKNPLDNFQTNSFNNYGKDGLKTSSICPDMQDVYNFPLKVVDYVSCHKLLLIVLIAVIGSFFFAGAKVVKKAKDGENGVGNKNSSNR